MTEENIITPIPDFYLDISKLVPMIEDLKSGMPNANSNYFLKMVEYYCDYKWDEIAANQFETEIQSVLFGILITNFDSFQNIQYQISCAQASFYLNNFSSWPGFVEWLSALPLNIQLLFYYALSQKINAKPPIFIQQITQFKEFFETSSLKAQFFSKAFSEDQSHSPIILATLAALSRWMDTSFIFDPTAKQFIISNLEKQDSFSYILKLYQHAICRIPQANLPEFINEYSNMDMIVANLQKFNTAATQVAFAEYIFFIFTFAEDEAIKNQFIEFAKSSSELFPAASATLLKIFATIANNEQSAVDMFSIGWSALLNLSNSADLDLSNVDSYRVSLHIPFTIMISSYQANQPEIFQIIRDQIFNEINPVEEPNLCLAQLNLLFKLLTSKNYEFLDKDAYIQAIMSIFELETEAIVSNMQYLVLIWFVYEWMIESPLAFSTYRQLLVTKFIEIVIYPELDSQIVEKFETKFPSLMQNSCKGTNEMVSVILQQITMPRLQAAAKIAMSIEDNAEKATLIGEIIKTIKGLELEPQNIASILLKFIEDLGDITDDEFKAELLPMLQEFFGLCNDDEICSLVMLDLYHVNAEFLFQHLHDIMQFVAWTKSAYNLMFIFSFYVPQREQAEEFTTLAASALQVCVPIIERAFDCYLGGLIEEKEMISLVHQLNSMLSRLTTSKIPIQPEAIEELNRWTYRAIQLSNLSMQLLMEFYNLVKLITTGNLEAITEFAKIAFCFIFSENFDQLMKGIVMTERAAMNIVWSLPPASINEIVGPFFASIGMPDVTQEFLQMKRLKNDKKFDAIDQFFSNVWKFVQVV